MPKKKRPRFQWRKGYRYRKEGKEVDVPTHKQTYHVNISETMAPDPHVVAKLKVVTREERYRSAQTTFKRDAKKVFDMKAVDAWADEDAEGNLSVLAEMEDGSLVCPYYGGPEWREELKVETPREALDALASSAAWSSDFDWTVVRGGTKLERGVKRRGK